MLMIRLKRQGAKKNPEYLVVVVDKDKKRDGGFIERIGLYYPKAKTQKDKLKLDTEKLNAWIAKGAQLSETVGQLAKAAAE